MSLPVNQIICGGNLKPAWTNDSQSETSENEHSGSANCHCAVERAKNIVRADEWEGDIRLNMTTVIGAGRVLAKRVEELEEKTDADRATVNAAAMYYEQLEMRADKLKQFMCEFRNILQDLSLRDDECCERLIELEQKAEDAGI